MDIYTFPEPFKCKWGDKEGWVIAYVADKNKFIWLPVNSLFSMAVRSRLLCPPPSIPQAAKTKPEVGQVWITIGGAAMFLAYHDEGEEGFLCVIEGMHSWNWYYNDDFARPATAEEAKPFRDMLENLKRSLGEA